MRTTRSHGVVRASGQTHFPDGCADHLPVVLQLSTRSWGQSSASQQRTATLLSAPSCRARERGNFLINFCCVIWTKNITVSCGWHQLRIPVSPWGRTKFRRELFPVFTVRGPQAKGFHVGKSSRSLHQLGKEGAASKRSFPKQSRYSSDGRGDWGPLNMESQL